MPLPASREKAKKSLDDNVNAGSVKPKPPHRRNRKQEAAAARFEGPWEPDAKELEIFERCSRYEPLSRIAKDMGCSAVWVMKVRDKVGQWKSAYHNDRTEALRARALQTYEHIIFEALDAWEKIKGLSLVSELQYDKEGAVASVNVPGGSPGDGYLKTVVSALNEIRKLMVLDKIPEKQGPAAGSEKRDDGSEGMRVAGMSRPDALALLCAKINEKLSKASVN